MKLFQSSRERAQLLAFPDDQAELIRLATLASDDLAFVRQRRGERNRLGIAVLLVYLRYGRILGEEEKPHENLLSLVAAQLEIAPSVWELYAVRDETRREHLLDLLARLGMEQFGRREYRSISSWLEPIALQTTRGMVLAQAVVKELRKRRIVLPPVPTIERLCGEAATRAQRKVFSLLTEDLSVEQRGRLDGLLELRPGSSYSTLSWLRLPAGAPPRLRRLCSPISSAFVRYAILACRQRSANVSIRIGSCNSLEKVPERDLSVQRV